MEAESRHAAVEGRRSRPQVLIADDDPTCLLKLERAFRLQGIPTVGCTDGREAWRTIQQRPGLILAVLNWMMPGMDGHLICRRLYELQSTLVPVLMIGRSFLYEAGTKFCIQTQHVLAKPLSETEINQQVLDLIRVVPPLHVGRRGYPVLSINQGGPSTPAGTLTRSSRDSASC